MVEKFSDQQIKAAISALKAHKEKPFVSHQWEELVLQLSHDNDPHFREKMSREMETILDNDPEFKFFRLF
jgi:hypothetical protein